MGHLGGGRCRHRFGLRLRRLLGGDAGPHLQQGQYHPLIRPALLASLFGYTLAGVGVIFDLGRWWNFWHIFWPSYSNPNSVMFEVAVCISAYIVVMWLEFSPAFFEKWGMVDAKKKLNKVLFFLVRSAPSCR